MANKLPKKQYPAGSGPSDFECYGPIATKDGDFSNCNIADLGCFNQSGVDSNKFYHAAVVCHKTTKKWFVYFQWGRTGSVGDWQFVECNSQQEAQEEFASQLHSKNDKRGQWVNKPGLGLILQAKEGKDCYLVRPLATRSEGSPGLPDARRVTDDSVQVVKKTSSNKNTKKSPSFDQETIRLMRDLNVAAISYTKANIQGGTLPTQRSIDEGRNVLIEAQKILKSIGKTDIADIVNNKELRELTFLIYGRIPKIKPVGAPESSWILSNENIFAWQQDLDAFESALAGAKVEVEEDPSSDFGMSIEIKHLPHGDKKGDFIRRWMPSATLNKHHGVGAIKIHNVWEVDRRVQTEFMNFVNSIDTKVAIREKARLQPTERKDVDSDIASKYEKTNTSLCFHGTRSCNVGGILREGLRFPKELVGVVITGAMFGPGHYWATDYKKSAGYTSLSGSYWSGGSGAIKNRGAFMFVADVALGRPHVASGPYGYTSPPKDCHSIFGKANVSGVHNDEWITFKKNQYQFRYLVEFSA